ncbi:unnamed protein product [Alternaria alternata]
MIVVGQWSCALVGYGGSFINNDWRWRMPILSQLLPPILMVVLGKILLPESPSWLVLHGQHEKAIAALRKFNSPNYDAAAAVAVLEAAVQRERTLQSESHASGNALLHRGDFSSQARAVKRDWTPVQDRRRPVSRMDLPEYASEETFLKWIKILIGGLIVKPHFLRETYSLSKYMPRDARFANGM